MDPAAWIALAGVCMTVLLNVAAYLVAWGVMRGTVTALSARVASLEIEMSAVATLKLQLAELKISVGFMLDQLKDLNASIRWMREPAPYDGDRRA